MDSVKENESKESSCIQLKNLEVVKITEGCVKNELILSHFESMSDELICSICLDIVWSPMVCGVCSSPYGSKCLNEWLTRNPNICPKQCAFKNTELSPLLKRIMSKLQFNCFYSTNGCKQVVHYEDFYKHVFSCDYAEYKCTNQGCRERGDKQSMIKHSGQCDFLKETCYYCQETLTLREFNLHQTEPVVCLEKCRNIIISKSEIISKQSNELATLKESINDLITKNKRLADDVLKQREVPKQVEASVIDKKISPYSSVSSEDIAVKQQKNETQEFINKFGSLMCKHDFSFKHRLKSRACRICNNSFKASFRCKPCGLIFCGECFQKLKSDHMEKLTCKKLHPLIALNLVNSPVGLGYHCDKCEMKISETTFRCEKCDYDICCNCYQADLQDKNCLIF